MGWPLVGREAEFRRLSESLAPGAGVLIVGDAGVGKTRLARSGIDAAYARGARTEWLSGVSGASGIPLAAVAHVIPDGQGDEGEPTRLMRMAATALSAPSRRSLVVGLDDAHLVDPASAAVVHHAVVNGRASLVATIRRGQELPEPVEVLVRDGHLERMDLLPLSDDEVAVLLTKALEGPVEQGTVERLCVASQGNPMLVRELVRGGQESGALAQRDGIWIWEGSFGATRLRDLVHDRLRRLSGPEHSAVELISAGAPLPLEVVESLIEVDIVEALDRAGLLASHYQEGKAEIRLAHPLYGEVLRATTSPLRRRKMSRELAGALAASADLSSNDILRIVSWRLEAGEPNDLEHLRPAARRALGASDFELAERVAWEGVERWGDDQSRILLGFAMAGQGRIDDAHTVLAEAMADEGARPQRDVLVRALDTFFYGSRTTSAATAVSRLQQVIAGVDDWPADTEPFVEAARAGVLVLSGDVFEAWAVADRVLGSRAAPPTVELRALIIAATMAAIAGRASDALGYAERGLAMIRSEGEATSAATDAFVELDLEPVMLAVGSLAHRIAGHLDEARAIAAAGHRRYLEESNGPAQGLFALALGQVELPAGRIAQADALFREAVALLRRPPALYLVWALGCLSQTASILGQVDAATESLAEAEEQRSATFQVFDCDVRLGQAWRAAATGDLSTARQIALESADSAAGAGQYGFAAVAAHDAARLGAPANASHLLDDLLRRTDSLAIEAFAEHARALAQEDIDALLDVAGRFDRLGCRLYAAEAYAEAASRLEDAGRAGAADRSGTRARSLLEECGDVRTPALARLDRTPMLTEREEEVARLALSGLTNRAIAARLQISVRTVDNHLHHAYEKLAVSGRDELGTVLK